MISWWKSINYAINFEMWYVYENVCVHKFIKELHSFLLYQTIKILSFNSLFLCLLFIYLITSASVAHLYHIGTMTIARISLQYAAFAPTCILRHKIQFTIIGNAIIIMMMIMMIVIYAFLAATVASFFCHMASQGWRFSLKNWYLH